MPPLVAGVLLQLTAIALFVAMDTLIKGLTAAYPIPQIVWSRFVFHLLTVAVAIRIATGALPWRARAPGLQALRSLALLSASVIFAAALARIPLGDATAVGFASPLITVALAAFWLRETVSPRRWLGVAVGLVGVMIALRPPFLTGEIPDAALLLPLGSALAFALYHILTRRLAALDDARTTILHTSLAALVLTTPLQPFVWTPPDAVGWLALAALGALGAFSHYLFVLAYARAPASLLGPLSYSQLIWAAAASWAVFGDAPDRWTLIGAAVIAAGGVLVAWPQRR